MTLETERLILRPYGEGDLTDYFAMLRDRKNLYYLDDIVTDTLEEARESLQGAIELAASGMARRFAILLKGEDGIIGGVGYDITAETPLGRVGHMGWFILPEHQKKGYVTEAARRVLAYAFDEDNCTRITTGCYRDNTPSVKVMEKVGFRLEAVKPKAQYHDGEMKDRLEYSVCRGAGQRS
jgi:ribosomal-protein-alanine N-acetyltransferase